MGSCQLLPDLARADVLIPEISILETSWFEPFETEYDTFDIIIYYRGLILVDTK
jgi:hypothetical protein